MILITGGAGFIGSNFVLHWCSHAQRRAATLDLLTYAANPANLDAVSESMLHSLIYGDIADRQLVNGLLDELRPAAVLHFAAESHVDRSILDPDAFVRTNLLGTAQLLEAVRSYWCRLPRAQQADFRFIHVSTDEVYGSLPPEAPPFTESSPYRPNSPYAASKAGSDHMARAYFQTYGLPVITTNCSNNYGPFQFPEKLIPLMVIRALSGASLPVYGDGMQIRDWLYVLDHCRALDMVLAKGVPGETYNIGGDGEKSNLDVVHRICALLDDIRPRADGRSYAEQIAFVEDRPGHDRRYAIDSAKIRNDLGWQPLETFETGLAQTLRWYLSNPKWVEQVTSGAYREWTDLQYGRHPVAAETRPPLVSDAVPHA